MHCAGNVHQPKVPRTFRRGTEASTTSTATKKASETHATHWDLDLGKCRHVRDPDNDPRWGRKFSSRGRPEDSFPSRQHAARLFSNLIPAPESNAVEAYEGRLGRPHAPGIAAGSSTIMACPISLRPIGPRSRPRF